MGTNLRPLVTPLVVKKERMRGKKVAIDGTNYLIKYLSSIKRREEILFGETGEPISHVFGFGYLVLNLLEAGMHPAVVLDGTPDIKKRIVLGSTQHRMAVLWHLHEVQDQGKRENLYHDKQFLFDKIKRDLRDFLAYLGVPCIVAPSEAEAQASFMAREGMVDLVFSEDYDCLLYGAPHVIKQYHSEELELKVLSLTRTLHAHGISRNQLVDVALCSGTEIFKGYKGIGPKRGLQLIREHGTLEGVCNEKGLEVPSNLDDLRAYYLRPPHVTHKLLWGFPSFRALEAYLQPRMNQRRLTAFIVRLHKALEKKVVQKTLF